uniref:Virion structural protein n=1 Tax=Pseudomonas phage RVTF4 TaxID=3236931 RepID=A0AB39CCJ4_9VIRU
MPAFVPFERSAFLDPDRGYREWLRSQIVSYPGEANKYIPNKDDAVRDWDQGLFRVIEVDQTTGMSILERWTEPQSPDPDGPENVLIATGPGYTSESFRIFLDQTVTPHTFSPDLRCHFYGTEVQGYKIFKGSDISEQYGKVISEFYDPSGSYIGPMIPVEQAILPGMLPGTQYEHGVTVPMAGYTSTALPDGERVTLVAYSANGKQLSIAQLVVVNSQAIRQPDTSKRYVKGISLDTAWLSSADPKVIEFPLNVAVETLPMTGLVHYRDGKKNRMSPTGGPMELLGLRNYIATEVGQEFKITQTYQLAPDEVSYGLNPTTDRKITVNYIARTTPAEGAYECRLFVYPVWVNEAAGYRLEFWLYNQDRERYWNITPQVELGMTSKPFDPKGYGYIQDLTYAVNLNEVDGVFKPVRFVATVQIALLTAGSNGEANWEIKFRPDQEVSYGRDLKANVEYIETNQWNLRLANGAQTQETWLQKMYYNAEPLINPEQEVVPPIPTHFVVHFLHNKYEYAVSQWGDVLKVNNDLTNDGELVYIQWIRRTVGTDLQLAMTALPLKQLI